MCFEKMQIIQGVSHKDGYKNIGNEYEIGLNSFKFSVYFISNKNRVTMIEDQILFEII